MSNPWIVGDIFADQQALDTEWRQCQDEGRDLSSVADEFERLRAPGLPFEKYLRDAEALLDRTIALPTLRGHAYDEPSDLAGIRAARPAHPPVLPAPPPIDDAVRDKIHGAWLGRCCGCLLGKPIECWLSDRIWPMLQATNNWPLERYIEGNVAEEIRKRFDMHPGWWGDQVECMPEDDDTNYTMIALEIMKAQGRDFTSHDIARFWLQNLPLEHTFTAERVAYRNLAMMIQPPHTATFRNPYREWIGAQIRADFYGYAAPGRPEIAAEWAWRDASLTHVKNGIYGAMWVAAMLAAAAVVDDIETIIDAGLAQIPARCRLTEAIHDVRTWHDEGIAYDVALERIHQRWDEKVKHHWCHTISNAQIVVIGLLWGNGELGPTICRAVQPCFDTDCNGATTGSIIGMIAGAAKLPAEPWTARLNDTLCTGIAGQHKVRISDLAEQSFQLVERLWPRD
ncbi:MAG: hypothetical protein PWP23_379 [Candidatus Sumerlaeota bacterium]|nr:hypothetical protein [Candidatus Sumerlaeota bacterium]